MLQDFLVPFVAVSLAELGDKTQLAILSLASKTKEHTRLFLGAFIAFLITDTLAVLLGEVLTVIIPRHYLKWGSSIIFLVFGIAMLIHKGKGEASCDIKNPFLSGLSLVFLAEMGDKTQLAAALFATQYHPLLVLLGVMLSLSAISIAAIYIGRAVLTKVNPHVVSKASGILFILIGLSFLF